MVPRLMFDVFLFFVDPGSGGCVFWCFHLLYMFVDLYPDRVFYWLVGLQI